MDMAQLARARRMANRKRSEKACLPCKLKKAKCSDYRPCARCSNPTGIDLCEDEFRGNQGPNSAIINIFASVPFTVTATAFELAPTNQIGSVQRIVSHADNSNSAPFNLVSTKTEDISMGSSNYEKSTAMFSLTASSDTEWVWEVAGGAGFEDPFLKEW